MDFVPGSTANPSFDQHGKLTLDHVYNQPDPRAYFSTLQQLDYCVPEQARPVFQGLLEARREAMGERSAKVVDVGCSYGVNAALLKHGLTMDELYRLYGQRAPVDPRAMLLRDQSLFAEPADEDLTIVGLDAADKAISYAVAAGALDGGVSANLEEETPSPADLEVIGDSDLIISTGCVGYVTSASLEHLVDASNDAWMANFVLRMFDYQPVEDMLAARGYVTEKLEGVQFPQRRFVSAEEMAHVLGNLDELGLQPEPSEEEGWYLAELYVSRPQDQADIPLPDLLPRLTVSPPA